MNEIQIARLAALVNDDMMTNPDAYTDENDDLPYLASMLADLVKISADEYDPKMLHGFTL